MDSRTEYQSRTVLEATEAWASRPAWPELQLASRSNSDVAAWRSSMEEVVEVGSVALDDARLNKPAVAGHPSSSTRQSLEAAFAPMLAAQSHAPKACAMDVFSPESLKSRSCVSDPNLETRLSAPNSLCVKRRPLLGTWPCCAHDASRIQAKK